MGTRPAALRSALVVVAGIVVLVAGAIALLAFFTARDDSEVHAEDGPGTVYSERATVAGYRLSGPHRPRPIARDRARLSQDQLLHALKLGDVVIVYGSARPPRALIALQDEVAGPFDADIAAAGSAIVLARRPGARGLTALAWRRAQAAATAGDPALRRFAEHWLGKGAQAP